MKRALINFGGPALAFILALTWMLAVGDRVPGWMERLFGDKTKTSVALGKITSFTGTAHLTRDHLERSLEDNFLDGDILQTSADSSVNFRLTSRDEFTLLPDSHLTFQQWDRADAVSPIYLKVARGQVTTVKSGTPGRAFLVQRGHLSTPGQKYSHQILAPPVLGGSGVAVHLTPVVVNSNEELDPPPAPSDKSAEVDPPQTLANETIDRMMTDQSDHLQRCWIARLKADPHARARLNLQFDISRRGRVRDFKVIDKAGSVPELETCVARVIESLRFPAFRGADITLNYPLTFE